MDDQHNHEEAYLVLFQHSNGIGARCVVAVNGVNAVQRSSFAPRAECVFGEHCRRPTLAIEALVLFEASLFQMSMANFEMTCRTLFKIDLAICYFTDICLQTYDALERIARTRRTDRFRWSDAEHRIRTLGVEQCASSSRDIPRHLASYCHHGLHPFIRTEETV